MSFILICETQNYSKMTKTGRTDWRLRITELVYKIRLLKIKLREIYIKEMYVQNFLIVRLYIQKETLMITNI